MTTLTDRPGTALLVIDVQNEVVADAHDRDGVVARIAGLVDRARAGDTPVVWVQHSDEGLPQGSDDWQIVPALVPGGDEALVHKNFGDSFEGTDLEEVLTGLGAGHLVVTGAQTDACIRSTIHGAFTRGYDVTLVADAHTTEDRGVPELPSAAQAIAHINSYWRFQGAPGRSASVVPAADVEFAAPA